MQAKHQKFSTQKKNNNNKCKRKIIKSKKKTYLKQQKTQIALKITKIHFSTNFDLKFMPFTSCSITSVNVCVYVLSVCTICIAKSIIIYEK